MSNPLDGFYVVLVEPTLPENVGAAARALNNFGVRELRLVNPCDYQSPAGRRVAANSREVLEGAQCFSTLREAVSQSNFVIGTTARQRDRLTALHRLPDLGAQLSPSPGEVALVFGRESSGLTNQELSCCNLLVRIPTYGTNPSFNLAQAVALTLYELSRGHGSPAEGVKIEPPLATSEELERLKSHWFAVLELVGFLKENRRETLWRSFSDLAARARMRPADVRLLRGFLRRTELTVKRRRESRD